MNEKSQGSVTKPKSTRSPAKRGMAEFFETVGGSKITEFNENLLLRVIACTGVTSADDDPEQHSKSRCSAMPLALGALMGFAPTDAIEGMIAAQATALHFASMECLRRAMLSGQPFEIASKLRRDGANLARAMTDMIEALDRKRGKGQQHIRVERVMVADGGQAIVGSVTAGATPAQPRAIEQGSAPMDLLDPVPEAEKAGG